MALSNSLRPCGGVTQDPLGTSTGVLGYGFLHQIEC